MEQETVEMVESVSEKAEQHGEIFAGFVGDVQANVLNSLSAQSVGPEGFVENFQGDACLTARFVSVRGTALCWFVFRFGGVSCLDPVRVRSPCFERHQSYCSALQP